MALIGGYLPDWALVPVWILIALSVFVRDLLIKVPVLGDLILKLYEPALSADEARDPAAYREAMLIVEQKLDIGVPVEHSYVQVRPDVFLHVAAAGDSSKPMMLFLHGFPEFWYSWRHLMKEFSSKYYCVALDQRGYNISSKPSKMTDYDMEALVSDVEFVVKKLSNGKPISLVAHDWGGNVAWHVAHCCDFVERLVICNMPHPTLMARALKTSPVQRRNSLYIGYFQLPLLPEAMLAPAAIASLIRSDLRNDKNREQFNSDAFHAAAAKTGAVTAMLNWYRAVFGGRVRKWQQKVISCPVLFLYGMEDVAFDRDRVLQGTDKYCSDVKLVKIDGCSHWTANDRPDVVIKEMHAFGL